MTDEKKIGSGKAAICASMALDNVQRAEALFWAIISIGDGPLDPDDKVKMIAKIAGIGVDQSVDYAGSFERFLSEFGEGDAPEPKETP